MPGPEYYWYRTTQFVDSQYKSFFCKGHHYLLFLTEPDYSTIDKLNLTYVGRGNIDYLKGVVV